MTMPCGWGAEVRPGWWGCRLYTFRDFWQCFEVLWRDKGDCLCDSASGRLAFILALREFVGLWSGWLVVGFMLGGVLGRRSFGGL